MRLIYNKLSKEIITVVDENAITAFPFDCAVIQGDVDMVAPMALAIGIDVSQIPEFNYDTGKNKNTETLEAM